MRQSRNHIADVYVINAKHCMELTEGHMQSVKDCMESTEDCILLVSVHLLVKKLFPKHNTTFLSICQYFIDTYIIKC